MSKAKGANLVVDHFLRGLTLIKKKKRSIAVRSVKIPVIVEGSAPQYRGTWFIRNRHCVTRLGSMVRSVKL